MKKRKERTIVEQLLITDIAAEGKALAKINDLTVFVDKAIPGDVVNIILYKKKNYAEGVVLSLVQAAPDAQEPFCEHFGVCGGCKWQRLPYAKQLEYKKKQVYDQLSRIGKLNDPIILPVLPAPANEYYRNKLEFTASNKKWLTEAEIDKEHACMDALGFHVAGRFDKVLDIKHCHLQAAPSNEIRLAVKDFALENKLEFFDIRQHTGLLRNLLIRNTSSGQLMVIVVFYQNHEEPIRALMQHLVKQFPEITSLNYVVNTKGNDSLSDQTVLNYSGLTYIEEEMEGLRFRIGPKSFYQTNSLQAHQLYRITRQYANLTGSEVVYDLYTGTGTIANYVAKLAQKVIGIEYVEEAIIDARINSELNGISNTQFFAGDMKDVLTPAFIKTHGHPDVVILDPPRAGLHPQVIEVLLQAAPNRIVYVSCNPASQARDIELLASLYTFVEAQPVDMFPHTHHIENVALLIKKE